jgi:superfamily II DNA or RNA helicase
MELRPYQKSALSAILEAEKRGVTRQLIIMATGLGKTVLVSGLLQEKGIPKTFGFMHRDMLLDQAREKMLSFCPEAKIGIEKASKRGDPVNDQIVLASIQTIGRKDRKRLSTFPREWPGLLWVDEAHHCPSDSYLHVLDHFGVYGDQPRRNTLFLGTTATPDRFDRLGYGKIFDDVVFRYGLREAIRDKWLADIHAYRMESDLQLRGVRVRGGDYVEKDLAKAILRSEMDEVAVQTWIEKCRGRKSLFFCVNQEHLLDVEGLLKSAGAKVASIVASTPPHERKAILELFHLGELEVLLNIQVLTEGFDAPQVDCLHILHPTKSKSLYTQIVGRGLRRTQTKTYLDLFDYTKNIHDLCSIGRIFDLPDSWELKGQSISEEADKVHEATAQLGLKVDNIRSLPELMTQLCEHRIEMLMGTLTDESLPSGFAWIRPSKEQERWVISWKNETYAQAQRMDSWNSDEIRRNLDKYKLWGAKEVIEIFKNELGNYEARWTGTYQEGRTKTARLDSDPSQVKLVTRIEDLIAEKRFHKLKLLEKDAFWRKERVSERQGNALVKGGVPQWLVPKLSRGDASNLLNVPETTLRTWFEGMKDPNTH